jgi:hypothetical protein
MLQLKLTERLSIQGFRAQYLEFLKTSREYVVDASRLRLGYPSHFPCTQLIPTFVLESLIDDLAVTQDAVQKSGVGKDFSSEMKSYIKQYLTQQ